ncbi:MAG: glycerol-3-phosphate 1-O-acyltransferase PlsY [Phycisphaerales bacterium]|nr:glycerol-3-phosphate 1-O-acyltransferase PlsY [Phycisphaerales bacterium]
MVYAGAYLVGSIPFGLILGLMRGVDIRAHGSGNIGATNAMRVLGRKLGALCFALDVLKGALPVALGGMWMGLFGVADVAAREAWMWMGVAAAAVAGHMFSPWIGFKGGKGVATGFGAMVGMWPHTTWPALLALAVFALSARLTRYVGISSCFAALSLPAWVALARFSGVVGDIGAGGRLANVERGWAHIAATALLGAVVIWKHRGNIRRTLGGTERRIGERITSASGDSAGG